MMSDQITYRVEHLRTGKVYGTYRVQTQDQALDKMAQDQGYEDFIEFAKKTGEHESLYVEEVEINSG